MTACLNDMHGDVTRLKPIKKSGNLSRMRGFSLLEIMVVLAVIAFSSGLLVWQINQSKKSLNFEEIISALERTVHGLRQYALLNGDTTSLEIDGPNGGWRISGEEEKRFQSNAEISAYAIQKPSNQKLEKIVFFPDGSASGAHIRIKSGKQHAVIYLDPLTGKLLRKD